MSSTKKKYWCKKKPILPQDTCIYDIMLHGVLAYSQYLVQSKYFFVVAQKLLLSGAY